MTIFFIYKLNTDINKNKKKTERAMKNQYIIRKRVSKHNYINLWAVAQVVELLWSDIVTDDGCSN